ncbi:MAG: hypothetical protein MJ066_01975 [Clostridia bacterium]|nr:hypothetical protein [Clostridia bacterium]
MKDLTKGNIYKTFLLFAIPLVLSGILAETYQIADSIIAGKFLGEVGLAAIGSTANYQRFINCIFWGLNMGGGLYLAKLFGASSHAKIIKSFKTQILFILIIYIVLASISLIFYKSIFNFLKIEDAIFIESFKYYAVCIAGLFFIALYNYFTKALAAFGMGKVVLICTIVTALINVVGNILSVTVLNLGVLGIAISSVLSSAVSDVICLITFIKCFSKFNIDKTCDNKINLKEFILYCIPSTIQQMSMYLLELPLSSLINAISIPAIAAFSLSIRIYDMSAVILQNSNVSIGNYSAQCYGKGEIEKVKKGLIVGIIQSIILVLPVYLTCIIFPNFVANIFLKKGDGIETITYLVSYTRCYFPFMILYVFNNAFHNIYRAMKKTGLLIFSTLFTSVIRLILSIIFVKSMGLYGIYLALVLYWIIEFIIDLIVFLTGIWKPKNA